MNKQLLLLCASLVLTGCNSAPGSSDIEDFLLSKFSSCKNIKVLNVEKTNGFEEDGLYRVEFSYDIKFDSASELHQAYLKDKERATQYSKESEIYELKKAELLKEIDKLEIQFKESTPSPYDKRDVDKAASDDWQKRRSEYTQKKRNELEGLENAWQQRANHSRSNGVLSNEGNVVHNFHMAGCGRDTYKYAPVSFPEKDEAAERTGDKSYMFKAHEIQMHGNLTMRKTEKGWRATSEI